jgi:predicted site-specific integrase-resolvase
MDILTFIEVICMNKMISISKVSELTGVTIKTLKIWDNKGKLKCAYKTVGGHRRYRLDDVEKFIGSHLNDINAGKKNVFIYSRVSTKKQMESGNLERQRERLISYCKEKQYNIVDIFKETASGLNDNRPELMKMFNRLDEVNSIVIEYPDRLARFGFNYLKEFAKSLDVDIETVEGNKKLEPNEEMVQDLISVVTCFSARLYGTRGGRKLKKAIKELEKRRGEACEDNNKSNIS